MEPSLPDTLIVRRLPEILKEGDLKELFHRFGFGVQEVRKENPVGRMRHSTVIVKFKCHEDAFYAMNRLHQQLVAGKRLTVEFANFSILPESGRRAPENFQNHYHWSYPRATEQIVKKISSNLQKNQEFYHKVVQLMNTMNLPPPFSEEEEEIQLPTYEIEEVEMEELYKEETEESELETDETYIGLKEIIPVIPKKVKTIKRVRSDQLKKNVEIILPKIIREPADIREVFEKKSTTLFKRLEVKISSERPSVILEPAEVEPEGFGKFAPLVESNNDPSTSFTETNEVLDNQEFITKQKILMNRLQKEEIQILPVFKNYSPGNPSLRLYVKNLAKTVKESDLRYIYGRYVVWTSDEEQNNFDIRLMTEGRMKGQAFITLPSIGRAEKALEETNGLMVQGKPLVVQFARSAQSKKE